MGPVTEPSLVADVVRALCGTGCPELRALEFSVEDACVTLSGRVRTYYVKQLAQAVVKSIAGVQIVKNGIVVD